MNFLQNLFAPRSAPIGYGTSAQMDIPIQSIDPDTGLPISGPIVSGPMVDTPAQPPMQPPQGMPAPQDMSSLEAMLAGGGGNLDQNNVLQAIGGSPVAPTAQIPAQQQVAQEPPRQRRSFLDTVGGIADVLARVGGAEALYQPTLDARQDRELAMEDRQRSIDMDAMRQQLAQQQIDAGEMSAEEVQRSRLAQALGAVASNPEAIAELPQFLHEIGVDPQKAAGILAAIERNPEAASIFAQALGFQEPQQGSLSSARQNYAEYQNILQTQGPEAAEQFLRMASPQATVTPYQQEQIGLKRDELDLRRDQFETEQSLPQAQNLTPGQKRLDQAFAVSYEDYTARGGYADVEKSIEQLRDVRNILGGGGVTGGISGYLPTVVRSVFNEKSVSAQEAVEEVVQRNLRLILGAQFTNEEGKRLIERAYNPRLSESENIKRLDRLITQIEEGAAATESASQYFEQNGTLTGWQGNLPGRSAPAAQPARRQSRGSSRANRSSGGARGGGARGGGARGGGSNISRYRIPVGTVRNGYKYIGGNPANRNNWRRVRN